MSLQPHNGCIMEIRNGVGVVLDLDEAGSSYRFRVDQILGDEFTADPPYLEGTHVILRLLNGRVHSLLPTGIPAMREAMKMEMYGALAPAGAV